jgi:hypothetical protein
MENSEKVNHANNDEITSVKRKRFINEQNNSNDTKICAICMEESKLNSNIDSCKHEFCKICIKKWSKSENTCPICKKRFKQILTINNNKPKYEFRKR